MMKKKGNQASNFPDGELQCFVGTRQVGKRVGNKSHQNGSHSESPTKRLSDILLMRRFIRGAAQGRGVRDNDDASGDMSGVDRRFAPGLSDHRLVGQSASSMSSASTNTNLRTNSSSMLMSTNSSSASGSGGYFAGGGIGVGRYSSRNSSVRSGRSCVSGKSNATVLTAVSSLAGSSSICSSASAAAAYKKGKNCSIQPKTCYFFDCKNHILRVATSQ